MMFLIEEELIFLTIVKLNQNSGHCDVEQWKKNFYWKRRLMRLLISQSRKSRNLVNPNRGKQMLKNMIHSRGTKFFIYLNNSRTCVIHSKSFTRRMLQPTAYLYMHKRTHHFNQRSEWLSLIRAIQMLWHIHTLLAKTILIS